MPTYRRANKDLQENLSRLCERYHPELTELGVKIDLLWAYADRDDATGEIKAPALTKDGYECSGICKVVAPIDRAAGLGDVRIILDHDKWESFNPRTQDAVLDHEISHIVIGDERDDLGRPKIKMRKHDVQVGWFKDVAERHGDHSMERIQAKAVFDNAGQAFFPFAMTEKIAA